MNNEHLAVHPFEYIFHLKGFLQLQIEFKNVKWNKLSIMTPISLNVNLLHFQFSAEFCFLLPPLSIWRVKLDFKLCFKKMKKKKSVTLHICLRLYISLCCVCVCSALHFVCYLLFLSISHSLLILLHISQWWWLKESEKIEILLNSAIYVLLLSIWHHIFYVLIHRHCK